MDYIDSIISVLSQFPNKENLSKDSVLKNTIILFSSLLRIRIIVKLEENFSGLDFDWITENTRIDEINEFIKNNKKYKIDYKLNYNHLLSSSPGGYIYRKK